MNFFATLFLLFSYSNCQLTYYLVQDEAYSQSDIILEILNKQRKNISMELDKGLFELNWDNSLAIMARRSMDNCDDVDHQMDGYSKVRFQLLMDVSRTFFQIDEMDERIVAQYLDISSSSNSPESDLDRILYPGQTRIGCSFKVCAIPPDYDYYFNHLCFLGQRNEQSSTNPCSGFCTEPIALDPSEIVRTWNSRRMKFAETVSAGNMYKLNWNETLQRKASRIAENCDFARYEAHFDSEFLPLFPVEEGREIGEKYLASSQVMRRKESKIYVPYQWDQVSVGCAHAPSCHRIVCVFGSADMKSELFKGGRPCSLCQGECENRLCLGDPDDVNKVYETTTSGCGQMNFWIFVLVEIVLIMALQ